MTRRDLFTVALFKMASGGPIDIQQLRLVSLTGVYVKPKEPLSRASKVTRSVSGYRTTNNNIAAIDFGTTSVTLSYTTLRDKEVSSLTLDEANKDTRVPNSILLHKNDKIFSIASFGNNAREMYTRMRATDKEKYVYFERIKMLMKKEQV